MPLTIGLVLSGAIGLTVLAIGIRFLIAPRAAAAGYGIAVEPAGAAAAYLTVKGVRDATLGLLVLVLLATGQVVLLAWFLVITTVIPLGDTVIVLRNGGSRAVAFGVHFTTAGLMLGTAVLLLAAGG